MSVVDTSPTWLTALRSTSSAATETAQAPSDSEEVWRYSRIADIDLEAFVPVHETSSATAPIPLVGAGALVVVRDGWITHIDIEDPSNVFVGPLSQHEAGEQIYGAMRRGEHDAVAHLHDASIGDPVLIDVPAGVAVAAPIMIDTYSDVAGGLTAPHTIIRAGRGSSVTVVERRRSGEAEQLVLPVVEIDAGPDSRVEYQLVQQLGTKTISIEHHVSDADQQAHVISAVAAFGGSYARTRADFRLVGRGASGDLLAAYFGDGEQMLDFRTFQEHAAPDTTSNLLFKGAVTGSASSVYTGLIRVADSAPGTNAFQTNRNLKLSDDAWAYSVPNLEIEQNDVSCSHASTVGEIDDEQRFYLESRGVPTNMAEQLLVTGFFTDVIEQMPVHALRGELGGIIDAALAADRATHEDAS
jgi:Fe-S cluster assembly protein SufD